MQSSIAWVVLDRLTTVVLLAVAATLAWKLAWPREASPPVNVTAERTVPIGGIVPAAILDRPGARGNAAARIVLLEFSDYQCPFCGRHARDVQPRLFSEYVDTGLVRYVFVNFPLKTHADAVKAAEAAECAGAQGRFWQLHDLLFAPETSLGYADLQRHAESIGVDGRRFGQCLAGEKASMVDADLRLGQQFAITSTPSFLIGSVSPSGGIALQWKVSGALPFDAFKDVITKTIQQ